MFKIQQDFRTAGEMMTSTAMTSTTSGPQCWRAARPCPLEENSANQKLACRAWFRCEMAGDYVIRWLCQSSEEGGINVTGNSFPMCPAQQDAIQSTDCPPPVVCADEPFQNDAEMDTVLSMDVILAIAVASFAFLAMLLIIASTYKYWMLRKRLRLRLQPRQYVIRDFPYPVRYHSLWGTSTSYQPYYDYEATRKNHSPRSYGSPYQDVYFARPQDTSRYFERLLSSSEESMENNMREYGRSSSPGRLHSRGGRHGKSSDPTVATGSFVFQTPVAMAGGPEAFKNRGWVHHKKQGKPESDSDKSLECYQIYRGNLSKFRTHEHHYATGNCENYRSEYHHLINAGTDISRGGKVSSIVIPSFEFDAPLPARAHHEHKKEDYQVHETKVETYDSDGSRESVTHYALGLIATSGNDKHYSSNVVTTSNNNNNNNNNDNDGRNNNHNGHHHHHHHSHHHHHHQSVTPKSSKSHTNGNSPDVISSHNFTNQFVRVGMNVYKPLLAKSASVSSITMSNNNNNNNNTDNNFVDLSYDSFRNEHLQELAKRGAASSSTLEAGYRQKGHGKDTSDRY